MKGLFFIIKYGSFFRSLNHIRKELLRQFPVPEEREFLFGHMRLYPGVGEAGFMRNYEWMTRYPRGYILLVSSLRPLLVLTHPETAKVIMRSSEPKSTQGGSYSLLYPWLGDGLLVSSDAKWFRNRRLLTPGFHFDVLKPYMNIFNDCSRTLLRKLEHQSAQTGNSVDVFKPVSLCTLDIILRCAFSTTENVQEQAEDPYVNTVLSLSELIVRRAMNPLLYNNFLFKLSGQGKKFFKNCDDSHALADDVIERRKKELEENTEKNEQLLMTSARRRGKYVDFLDILLLARDEDGEGLSDQEIRDEVETFMFEGHDTTASGISWILYNLATHLEIQTRAREEVDAIFDAKPEGEKELEWDDLQKLTYLTMCIKESLRTHPPVHFIARETTKACKIDGKEVPAETLVNIAIWNIHHNPTVWPDPFKYDPERFQKENISKMDSYAFVPFSAGPRNCIGQVFAMNEMKTTVAHVLRHFRLKGDTQRPPRLRLALVLRSENGVYLKFEKRSDKNYA